jgi:hypothetical protein
VPADTRRPLVVEEFGLTKRYFDSQQIKVVVAVVADALIAAEREGTPLMGAWIWQAAPIGKATAAVGKTQSSAHCTVHTIKNLGSADPGVLNQGFPTDGGFSGSGLLIR